MADTHVEGGGRPVRHEVESLRGDARGQGEPPPELGPDGVGSPAPRHRRPVLVAAIVVAVVLAFLVGVFAVARGGGGDSADTPLLGRPAPALSGSTLGGGGFDLSTRRGSWVVLNFFASWCAPCEQEAPELARFAAAQDALGANGAEIVGVVYNDSEDAVTQFLADHGNGFDAVVFDEDGRGAIGFGVVKIPETWIIDPNGIVRRRLISAVTADLLAEQLAAAELEAAS